MSHGDSVVAAPPGFDVLASTRVTPVAAFEDTDRRLAGVQWHPEVLHTEHGQQVLEHFLHDIAGCRPTWTMVNIVDEQVDSIREQIGDGRAICALSGGVDSAVAAAIVQRAIGDRLTCVYVDHGMMRSGETEQVRRDFEAVFDKLDVVDASDQFLGALEGIHDPEEKRKIIGREFIRTFEAAEARVFGDAAGRRDGVPGPGHALPRRRGVRRGSGHLQHQVPPQRRRAARRPASSSWSSRCARCSRTRCGWSASSSACRRPWCGASRSPAPAWASGSSARSPANASTSCARPT